MATLFQFHCPVWASTQTYGLVSSFWWYQGVPRAAHSTPPPDLPEEWPPYCPRGHNHLIPTTPISYGSMALGQGHLHVPPLANHVKLTSLDQLWVTCFWSSLIRTPNGWRLFQRPPSQQHHILSVGQCVLVYELTILRSNLKRAIAQLPYVQSRRGIATLHVKFCDIRMHTNIGKWMRWYILLTRVKRIWATAHIYTIA